MKPISACSPPSRRTRSSPRRISAPSSASRPARPAAAGSVQEDIAALGRVDPFVSLWVPFVLFAALTFVSLLNMGINFWLAIVISLAVMIGYGIAVERVVLRRGYRVPSSVAEADAAPDPTIGDARGVLLDVLADADTARVKLWAPYGLK